MAVVTKKIANLPESTSVASTDVFVKETSGGVTEKINASNFIKGIGLYNFTNDNMSWSTTDADNIKESGFYCMSTGANVPVAWGILFVIAPRSDTVRQIYFGYSSMHNIVSVRSYQNNVWSSWENL